MNKQQLAAKIWESANQMRSKIEANEYKDYILGFIFYKYLSDQEVQFAKKQGFGDEDIENLEEEDAETVGFIKKNIGYFIAHEHLFSTWIAMGNDFDISCVRDGLSAFSRLISPKHKKLFDGIFDTLQTGLSKLGENAGKQTKAASRLIHLINDIPMDGKQDYDVLGFVYEYLIGMFAANAGKKAGEFYTPHEVSVLMSEIVADHLRDRKRIQIYDPTSGSGSLLITIGNSVAKYIDDSDNVKYYAQELKQNTYNLTRMNLVMRGLLPDNIVTRNGDTLEDDWPYFEENDPAKTYDPLYVDAVVSNPPYSQKWDPANKEADPRYSRFGLAPKGKADYAFLLHDLYHVKPEGIMTIVLPHGVLFRGGEEGAIRKNLIEENHIDAVIGLPPNIFFGTGIPTTIVVLKQKRNNTDVLIIDASKGFAKVGKNNKLRASDIKRITDVVRDRKAVEKFSRVVTKEELRANEYNLNIPRYVDSSEKAESWDIYASMFGGIPEKEIDEMKEYWLALPGLREDLFSKTSPTHAGLKTNDIKKVITEHNATKAFKGSFGQAFADFGDFLKKELLDGMKTVVVSRGETSLGKEIFSRLEAIPLIDKYEAYQLLSDCWAETAEDLEVIQTDGIDSVKKVNPNMVMKKKQGKEQEVQEGWVGYILPFELVQETYLKEELAELKAKENRLVEIATEYTEVLGSFTDEEKENEVVNDAKDGFVNAAITKEAKQLKAEEKKAGKFTEDSYEASIIRVSKLIGEEKQVKKEAKVDEDKLHLLTKQTIENLADAQVRELLELKWIDPLVTSLGKLPDALVDKLTNSIEKLVEKYATTYSQVTEEIQKTEEDLSLILDELVGNETDMKGLGELKSILGGK